MLRPVHRQYSDVYVLRLIIGQLCRPRVIILHTYNMSRENIPCCLTGSKVKSPYLLQKWKVREAASALPSSLRLQLVSRSCYLPCPGPTHKSVKGSCTFPEPAPATVW